MVVYVARLDPQRHRFVAERPPHPTVDVALETRSLLLHDFAHYAVEGALATEEGFYGLVAGGADVARLREHQVEGPVWERLLEIETQVVLLQTAFKRSEASPELLGWDRLRAVHGAWSKVGRREALRLPWPAGSPEVVPLPNP